MPGCLFCLLFGLLVDWLVGRSIWSLGTATIGQGVTLSVPGKQNIIGTHPPLLVKTGI
jgi:hypothetical protein